MYYKAIDFKRLVWYGLGPDFRWVIMLRNGAVRRSGKSTHISMISNSVTYLPSYTNTAIASNSARLPTSTHRAPMSPHRAPISSHQMMSVRVFHDVLIVVHDVLLVVHDVLRCITMFYTCFMMFYNV